MEWQNKGRILLLQMSTFSRLSVIEVFKAQGHVLFSNMQSTVTIQHFRSAITPVHVRWAATWQDQLCECAPSEDSDQPGHPPSLIRVFTVRMKKPWVFSYPLSAQWRLWLDWADAQADLSLLGIHSFCWFCHVVAQISIRPRILYYSFPSNAVFAWTWYGFAWQNQQNDLCDQRSLRLA